MLLHSSRTAFALLSLVCATHALAADEKTGGPFVPTPQAVVDAMLDMAQVTPRDFVIDLGSGDGRIVLTAARRYSARGIGYDIDSELVESSNAEARKLGLAERVSFTKQDVLEARVADATVLTLYLLPGMMQMLQTKLSRELKPGTRIVAHDFPFSDWKPDRERVIDVAEKYGSPGNWKSTLFYWVVPASIEGVWIVSAPSLGAEMVPLSLHQRFQVLEGMAQQEKKRMSVAGQLEGTRVAFTIALPQGLAQFRGTVEGNRMQGEVTHAGAVSTWQAVRVPAEATASR